MNGGFGHSSWARFEEHELENLYVVRRAEAQAAALGTREAVIVLLEADDDFFTPPTT